MGRGLPGYEGSDGGRRRRPPGIGYTVFVQTMRLVLPVVTVALVLVVALWSEFVAIEEQFEDTGGVLSIEDAERLRMTQPRYSGVDQDGQPFQVTADGAQRDETDKDLVLLENPVADVTLSDGAWVLLRAENGVYNQTSEVLNLDGDVQLFHDGGYEFHTPVAVIDLADGIASGDQGVVGNGPFGDVDADGFVIKDDGMTIEFTGRAMVTLRVNSEDNPL